MSEKELPSKQDRKKVKKSKKNYTITVKANRKGRHIMKWLNLFRVIVLPIYFLLRPCRFYGKRKVKDGACIYISNHFGIMDPAYTAVTTWEGIHYIGKKEIFTMPLFGWIARKAKAISVNRDGNDVRGLLDCFKCLKNGEKICIFPEGTRNKTASEIAPFHHGAAVMAIKCKVPIVPIVMYTKPRMFRCTHILIDEPFELSEYYDKKMKDEELSQVDEKLRQHMIEMKRKHKEFLENKKKA